MKKDSFAYGIALLTVLVVLLLLGAWLVSILWNFLMPELFGLATINIGQALALMVLCNWLFGGSKSAINKIKEKD